MNWRSVLNTLFPRANDWERSVQLDVGGSADEKPLIELDPDGKFDAEYATALLRDAVEVEARRKQSSDTKAALYIAFLGASLPVLGTLKPESGPLWLATLEGSFLLLAVLYVGVAALNAMVAIRVEAAHLVGAKDIATALAAKENSKAVTAGYMIADLQNNQTATNRKVSKVAIAQRYIVRAFVALLVVVFIRWTAPLVDRFVDAAQTAGAAGVSTQTSRAAGVRSQRCDGCSVEWHFVQGRTTVRLIDETE